MTTPLQITIPAVTDTSLPYFHDDSDNVEGSLVRVQLDHPSNPVAGVPTNGQAIPNIAWREANRVLGGGNSQSALACTYNQVGFTGTSGKVERSTKGGLHVISSKTVMVAGHGGGFEFPTAIKTYLLANPTHSVYIGLQKSYTRLPAYNPDAGRNAGILHTTSVTTVYLAVLYETGPSTQIQGSFPSSVSNPSAFLGHRTSVSALALGPTIYNVGSSGWQGTPPTIGNLSAGYYFGDYPNASFQPATGRQQHSSEIFYELYCEDLTVSGRTYAQVDAAQLARYTANITTGGGRYNGDTTPTAPSSIP